MPSLKISPKYGVNPTIPICLYCGQKKNEVALMGRVKKKDTRFAAYGERSRKIIDDDVQMPMSAVIDAVPCDECQANWQIGVPIIRASKTYALNMTQIRQSNESSLYLNGAHVVVTREAFNRIFRQDRECGNPIYLNDEIFDKLFGKAIEKSQQ